MTETPRSMYTLNLMYNIKYKLRDEEFEELFNTYAPGYINWTHEPEFRGYGRINIEFATYHELRNATNTLCGYCTHGNLESMLSGSQSHTNSPIQ